MPNLNQLIISSQTCSIVLTVPTGISDVPIDFELLTVQTIDFNDTSEGELIYSIGNEDPIGNKSNTNKYDGKITMQLGEVFSILALCGFNSSTQIRGAQLSIAALTGGFVKSYQSVNINSDSSSVKAKDKETLTTMDFLAIGLS